MEPKFGANTWAGIGVHSRSLEIRTICSPDVCPFSLSLSEVLSPEQNSRECEAAVGGRWEISSHCGPGSYLVNPSSPGSHSWGLGPLGHFLPLSLPSGALGMGRAVGPSTWDNMGLLHCRGSADWHPHQVPALLPGHRGESQLLSLRVPHAPHLLEP